MRLVQEGKLSPEDAAELIDAFQIGEPEEVAEPEAASQATPPPPPPGAPGSKAAEGAKDPFKSLIDAVESVTKDVTQSVNWQEVGRQVREGAQKGVDQLKIGLEKVKEGKLNFDLFGSTETRVVELPLSVEKGQLLKIDNPAGDVKITGGASAGSVKAIAKVRGLDPEEAKRRAADYTLVIEESEHQVSIRQPDVSGLSVDLEVQLPAGISLDVRTLSGNVTATGTESALKASVGSGNLVARNLNGPIDVISQSGTVTIENATTPSLTLENRSGDVLVRKVTGTMNIRTASGDLKLVEASGKTISIESVSGDVDVDLVEPVTGAVNIRTVNGEAKLGIPDGSDCRVSLSTLRGTVTCSLSLDDEARADQHITGRLGGGTGTLDISAVNGDIEMGLRNATTV